MFKMRCIDGDLNSTYESFGLNASMKRIIEEGRPLLVDEYDYNEEDGTFHYEGHTWSIEDFVPYEEKILIGGELL